MQNTKVIDYLKTLDRREIGQIELLISQNSTTLQLTNLFQLLIQGAPKFDTPNLGKNVICQTMFSKVNKTNLKKLTTLSLRLCEVIEKYWIQKEIDKEDYQKEMLLLEAFKERGLNKYFYKQIEKSKKVLSQKTIMDKADYQHLLHLESERYFHPDTSKYDTSDNGMQDILNLVEENYTANKLKYTAEAKQIQMFVNRNFEYFKLDHLIVSNDMKFENPLSQMYFLIIQLLSKDEDDWEAIHHLMALFKQYLDDIHNKDEKLGILNFLINYSSIHYTKNIEYYEVLFQNLKLGMEAFLLIENGVLHEHYFANTCVVACELGHTEWLEDYTKNYIQYVNVNKREKVRIMAEVCLLYAKAQFSEILIYLAKIDIEKINENFWYRVMELRCLFELEIKEQGYDFIIESRLEAFRRYCYRQNDMNKPLIISNLNFIKNFTKIQTWEILSKAEKADLSATIKIEATVCKLWLLKKIKML